MKGIRNLIDHNYFHDKPKSLESFLILGHNEMADIVTDTVVVERNHFDKQLRKEMKNSQELRPDGRGAGGRNFGCKMRYNLFKEGESDEELIANKSGVYKHIGKIARGNRGSTTIRHGCGNKVTEDVFEDNHGDIRIFAKKNHVRNNCSKNGPLKNVGRDGISDDEVAAIVVGIGDGKYTPLSECTIEDNIINKIEIKFERIIRSGANNHSVKLDGVRFVSNKIYVSKIKNFGYQKDKDKDNQDIKDDEKDSSNNTSYSRKGKYFDIALSGGDRVHKKLEFNSLPEIKRLKGVTKQQPGPCSEILEYSFEINVKPTLREDLMPLQVDTDEGLG